MVGIALEQQALSGSDIRNEVRPAAERRRKRGLIEGRGVGRVLGQNRHQPEDQRQLAVVRSGEIEANGALADGFGAADLGIVCAVIRTTFVTQQLPREDHVLGRDRMPVGEFCPRIERKRRVAARRIGFDRLRQQTIERERLVEAARHQTLDDVAAHVLERQSFDDERIEAVEAADNARDQTAGFRRGRIDVAKMREAGRERRTSVHGDRMGRLGAQQRPRGRAGCERGPGDQHGGSRQTTWRKARMFGPGADGS